jgi:16S rRNA (cytidine1402-2'-O)-methyltransferase
VANGSAGRLYVVATPIGNLNDFSARARETLAGCSLIAAEDTRHTGNLLKHFAIRTPMISLHDHNETGRAPEIVQRLTAGDSVALVSDAGTPAISDPGFGLVRAAAEAGIEIISIPGPCAAIAALSIGGLPTDRFCFEGFLPAKSRARRERLTQLEHEVRTLVFYESPHRVSDMLDEAAQVFGATRPAMVMREATKLHESTYRGNLEQLSQRASQDADFSRGEIVVVIAGAASPEAQAEGELTQELDKTLKVLMAELPLKQAAHLAAKLTGMRDNEAYRRALALKDKSSSP